MALTCGGVNEQNDLIGGGSGQGRRWGAYARPHVLLSFLRPLRIMQTFLGTVNIAIFTRDYLLHSLKPGII